MDEGKKIVKSEEEWKKMLSPEEFRVLREKGTERAFSGQFYNSKEEGIYKCAACGSDLFSSKTKYDSGTGWPSFWDPISLNKIETADDINFIMKGTEVMCGRCGSHLGHVFQDGPKPTGKRYCINSVSLRLNSDDKAA